MELSARVLPQAIPGFNSLKLVGEGAASDSVLATSEKTRAPVHLDVLRPEALSDARAVQHFVETAKKCLELSHPNLVRHVAVDRMPDGRWFLATETGEGQTLAALLARRPLAPEELEQLVTPLCAALDYLHTHGLLHGDLRPENVLLTQDGATLVPRLTGFALSALNGPRPGADYAAPERIRGQMVTPRSDLYSLGALLHTCLTGKPPFTGRSAEEVFRMHLEAPPPPLPGASAHLTDVLHRCLAKDPVERYATASEVANTLNRFNGTLVPPSSRQSSPGEPLPPTSPARGMEAEGDVLGSYQLVRLLGEGSMGRVFQARHTLLGRQVAIKILRPEQYRNSDLIQRFFQEARTVNQINHEHIVEIFDFVQEPGADGPRSVYCVMELLGGTSLSKLLATGPLGIQRSLNIVRQLCEALAAAHKVGVVHRDVKPDNIFIIERAGQRDYVKVLDFGVAKLLSPLGEAPVISTMDGAIIGTPTCMSPEQAAGLAVDHRSDIWAVGVILYEALTGRLPFDAQTFGALAAQIITKPPPPMPAAAPGGDRIPPALTALVLRCLEKDPVARPQSMLELRDGLLAACAPTVVVAPAVAAAPRPVSAPRPVVEKPRSSRAGLVVVAALVALGGAGAFVWFKRPFAAQVVPPTPVAVVAPIVAPTPTPVEPAPVKPEPDPEPAPVKPAVAKVPVRPAGPLTMKEIAAVMSRSQGDIFRCFERHRTQLTQADGQVLITLSIDPPGAVNAARVSTPGLAATPLADCIVKEARRLRFPKHTGPPVTINVPFAYKVE